MSVIRAFLLVAATFTLMTSVPACGPSHDGGYYLQRGIEHDTAGEHDEAIHAYNKGIERDSRDPLLFYNRGVSHYRSREFDLAVSDFARCIELAPDMPEAYLGRGGSYADKGNYESAAKDFAKAVKLDPRNPNYLSAHGEACFHLQQYDQALADLDTALEIDPDRPAAYAIRGAIHNNTGHFNLAVEDYTRAIKLDPSDATYHANRGVAYANLRQRPSAEADFNRAIELDGDGEIADFARQQLKTQWPTVTRFVVVPNEFTLDATTVSQAALVPVGRQHRYGILIVLSEAGWQEMQRLSANRPSELLIRIGDQLATRIANSARQSEPLWPREIIWTGPMGGSRTPADLSGNIATSGFSKSEAEALIRIIQHTDNDE